MTRPRLLDLFCGAGGAAMGYHRAGFDVVGVDLAPQLRYPFKFVQADAMDVLEVLASQPCPVSSPKGQSGMQSRPADRAGPLHGTRYQWLDGFDAIHASPPCQRYVRSGMFDRGDHPDLLPGTRTLLEATGLPWVIENVPGAPMRADLKLCGCMFGLPDLKRERWFETSWHAFSLREPCHHPKPVMGVYGHPRGGEQGKTWGWGTFDDWKHGMGIDWMTAGELAEAIPPAYTEYIGARLLEHLAEAAA